MKDEMVAIPREAFDFLLGKGPLDGTWFDELNANLPGRFWWRAILQSAAIASIRKDDELRDALLAWRDERMAFHKAERRDAMAEEDELSASNAVGAMLELHELRSWLIDRTALSSTSGDEALSDGEG